MSTVDGLQVTFTAAIADGANARVNPRAAASMSDRGVQLLERLVWPASVDLIVTFLVGCVRIARLIPKST